MPELTGYILVWGPSTDSPLPSHHLVLTENSRPALILHQGEKILSTWIPTVNSLDDALLMVGMLVQKDPQLLALKSSFRKGIAPFVELYESISQDQLQRLYQLNRKVLNIPLTIMHLNPSGLFNNPEALKHYPIDFEYCSVTMKRSTDPFSSGEVWEAGQ